MSKQIRQTQGQNVYDPSAIEALEFSPSSGAKKVAEVGRRLLPLKYFSTGTLTYTTDASTARRLDFPGKNLAVYNNDTSVHAVTLGAANSAPTALAAGVTNSAGEAGIPCTPGTWTYIACGPNVWVITDDATLLVFLIDDETNIKTENP